MQNEHSGVAPSFLESGVSPRLRMSPQQRTMLHELQPRDPRLAGMYMSVLMVLLSNDNPDKLALAAHNVRELMEKLPASVNVRLVANRESLKSKVNELQDCWLSTKTKCRDDQTWSGPIDRPLAKLLQRVDRFFGWYGKHFPRRLKEFQDTIVGLDVSQQALPKGLADLSAKRWDALRGYFVGVAHHDFETNDTEFGQRLDQLERFFLDLTLPRPFEDFDAIDALIHEVEHDA